MFLFRRRRWKNPQSKGSRSRLHEACFTPGVERLEERTLPSATVPRPLPVLDGEVRAIDGTGNNLANPSWGAANIQLTRMAAPAYGDGIATPAGAGRPSPRAISNTVNVQADLLFNHRRLSDFVFQWGQFLDHDLDLTGGANPAEPLPILVPAGDPHFDPDHTGRQVIPFSRSDYDPATGSALDNPRQQRNQITAYIDASNVYGSDPVRAAALRTFAGGKLKTSAGDLLPFNTLGLPNAIPAGAVPEQFFLAGDVRVNEQVALTALHTLFVREHNRLADELAAAHPDWDDEAIYQRARKIVGAQMQVITYHEFLPALLGPHAPARHARYDPSIDTSILNEFSTALFRVGHTMLSMQLLRLQNDGTPAPGGPVRLAQAFFNPGLLATSADLDYLLKGLASQRQQEVDAQVVDAVRNFLFGPPGAGGLDLASLNLQRGRDHGLPDYNPLRAAFGLPRVTSFADITSDVALQDALRELYGSVDDIDAWVGALAEDHLRGASVGVLLSAVLNEQFRRLRDGDRFWYENDPAFTAREIAELRRTRLADIIRRNTGITSLQRNVFFVRPARVIAAAGREEDDAILFRQGAGQGVIRLGSVGLVTSPPTVWKIAFGQTDEVDKGRLRDGLEHKVLVGGDRFVGDREVGRFADPAGHNLVSAGCTALAALDALFAIRAEWADPFAGQWVSRA